MTWDVHFALPLLISPISRVDNKRKNHIKTLNYLLTSRNLVLSLDTNVMLIKILILNKMLQPSKSKI